VSWRELDDVYAAMDLFAFASLTETQGLVLAEAMAAGVPVVALDAAGVRDVVRDGANGVRVDVESEEEFARALEAMATHDERRRAMSRGALETASTFSSDAMTGRLAGLYRELIERGSSTKSIADSPWSRARRLFAEELKILGNIAQAVSGAGS
jgi:glycosyltransferase involved in cell wall biosynthesis